MSAKNNGGYAFPRPDVTGSESQSLWEAGAPGMTLRDYFASLMLETAATKANNAPDYALQEMFGEHRAGIRHEEITAALAYRYADAMLRERSR